MGHYQEPIKFDGLLTRAISKYKPPPPGGGGYIWRGDLTEGFFCVTRLGELIFGGAYFRNFTVLTAADSEAELKKDILFVGKLLKNRPNHRSGDTSIQGTLSLDLRVSLE